MRKILAAFCLAIMLSLNATAQDRFDVAKIAKLTLYQLSDPSINQELVAVEIIQIFALKQKLRREDLLTNMRIDETVTRSDIENALRALQETESSLSEEEKQKLKDRTNAGPRLYTYYKNKYLSKK